VNASTGALTANRTYTVFGQPQQPVADPVGFGGQVGYYTDAETGFVLCTARYYDPTLGRWLTRDPIGYDGGIDVYTYCNNNSEMNADPSGLDTQNQLLVAIQQWFKHVGGGISGLSTRLDAWDCPARAPAERAVALTSSALNAYFSDEPHLLGQDNPLVAEVEGGSAGMAADPAWFLANMAMSTVDAPEEAVAGAGDAGEFIVDETTTLAAPGEDLYVGTYSSSRAGNIRTGLNDTHTPHHVVQDAVSQTTHSRGITINLDRTIHATTGTFRRPARVLPTLRDHLAADVNEMRGLLRSNGYARGRVNRQLRELIRQNKAQGGFDK
jgi:RHS repeat-associated protein